MLDDKESNILNKPEIFDLTTELIQSDYALNFDNASKKYKALIAADIKNSEDDLLDW